MDKLKGSGNTFSTSGKHWRPFRSNPKIVKRNARLHRLIRAGIIKPMTKAELRAAAQELLQAMTQQNS